MIQYFKIKEKKKKKKFPSLESSKKQGMKGSSWSISYGSFFPTPYLKGCFKLHYDFGSVVISAGGLVVPGFAVKKSRLLSL